MSEEVHFQEYQFDKRLNGNAAAVARANDILSGFQVITVSVKKRELPEWAKTKEGIQSLLLTAFPKLHINQRQRQRAGRWAQVIELFYLRSWTESEVSDALGETLAAVRSIVRAIIRTSNGQQANGKPRVKP